MRLLEYLLDRTPRLSVRPTVWGTFHIVSVAIVLGLFIGMVLLRRHLPRGERALRHSLAVFGIGLLLLEIGKQLVYSYTPGGHWDYNWDRFPFQFCSTPIYVALIAMWLPDGRLRRALTAFLATYSPVAGCAVLFYPAADVFHEILFLDLHTMLWHGAMLLYGLYLWLTEATRPAGSTALSAALVFLPTAIIALALNEAEHLWHFAGEDTFNMFYISRHGTCHIPLLSWVQANAPYPVFFAAYILLLGMGGALVTLGMGLVRRWWCARNTARHTTAPAIRHGRPRRKS